MTSGLTYFGIVAFDVVKQLLFEVPTVFREEVYETFQILCNLLYLLKLNIKFSSLIFDVLYVATLNLNYISTTSVTHRTAEYT